MRKILALLFLLALPQYISVQQIIPVAKGQQQEAAPGASITPASLDFGDQVVKRASKPQRITVTNTGGKELYINSVVVGGDNKQDFVMSHDTCTGSTIKPQKSCVVDVVFTPLATEKRKALLTFTDNAIDSPQNVQMEGTGINSVKARPGDSGRGE